MSAATYAGKSIVLTGASSGIGRALALGLARQRPRLALAARDTESLADVAAECRALGAEAVVVPTDVSDPSAAAVPHRDRGLLVRRASTSWSTTPACR